MNLQYFYPDTYNPVTEQWDNSPYPDLPLLRHQTLEILSHYKTDEKILSIIYDIESYVSFVKEEIQKDDELLSDYDDLDDIRWHVFAGIDEINPDTPDREPKDYFAALALIFMSQVAYHHNNDNHIELARSLGELYRSLEEARRRELRGKQGLHKFLKENDKEVARYFASKGGRKSTSVLTLDKPDVLDEWKKIKPLGLKREKATIQIIDKLGLKQQPSTIKTWIREYEKEQKC